MKDKQGRIKVATILGTRPEIIRLSRILCRLDQYVQHTIIYTGQNYDYELNEIFFKELKLRKPDYYLDVKARTLGGQIGKIIEKSEVILKKTEPDALLVLGDTNSALAAIIAKRLKIPIFHMEAGNRCFDENVPEEINRKIIDHISDINLPYTEHSRRYLIAEGIHPGTIYVTGSPLTEVLNYYQDPINTSSILKKLRLKKGQYFLVSAHREENVDSKQKLSQLFEAFSVLIKKYQYPLIITTHPRTRKRLEEFHIKINPLIKLQKPFGFFDYVFLQKNAFCVLSDSGTIQEESAILHFPAVQIRTSSERPEAFDAGTIILAGLDQEIILQAVHVATRELKEIKNPRIPLAYKDINISSKVLRLILGLSKIIKEKKYQ